MRPRNRTLGGHAARHRRGDRSGVRSWRRSFRRAVYPRGSLTIAGSGNPEAHNQDDEAEHRAIREATLHPAGSMTVGSQQDDHGDRTDRRTNPEAAVEDE